MSLTIDQEYESRQAEQGIEEREHELIRDLGRRLGCLWSYDRDIDRAEGRPELQEFWRRAQTQEQTQIDQLKALIHQLIESDLAEHPAAFWERT